MWDRVGTTGNHTLFHHIYIDITFLFTKLACVRIFFVKADFLLNTDFVFPVLHVSIWAAASSQVKKEKRMITEFYHASFFCVASALFRDICENIARGTTDPEIDSMTCTKFGHHMATLALVANLATRWRHLHKLQIWPLDGTTCISCKFAHQMVPLV